MDDDGGPAVCQHVSMTNIIYHYLLASNFTEGNDSMALDVFSDARSNSTEDTFHYYDDTDFLLRTIGPWPKASIDNGGEDVGDVGQNLSMSPSSSSSTNFASPIWFRFVIPIICAVGITGNLLNIAVLTRRRLLSTMQSLERSVTHGLTALAVSDLLFCVAVLPQGGFLDDVDHLDDGSGRTWTTSSSPLTLAYRIYGVAVVNLLLMQSTWLVTMMAACRYLVVVYPLKARQKLTGRATIASIAVVVVTSVIVTAPHFVAASVERCWTVDLRSQSHRWHYEVVPLSELVMSYVRWVWPVCSTFVPLAALGAFNVRLVRELNAARPATPSGGGKPKATIGHFSDSTLTVNSIGSCEMTRSRPISVKVVNNDPKRSTDGMTSTRTTSAGRKVSFR